MSETEEYKNSNFKKARPDVSYEKNKNNFFVSNLMEGMYEVTPGSESELFQVKVPAVTSLNEAYTNPNNPATFKNGGNARLNSFTLVSSKNVEHTIEDHKGAQKVFVEIVVIDENKLFTAQDEEGRKQNLPPKNSVYFIEKTYLRFIEPSTPDPPQSKVVVNPRKDLEKPTDSWTSNVHKKILTDDQNYYVVYNTIESSWSNEEEQDVVLRASKQKAIEYFMSHYNVTNADARLENFIDKSKISDTHVSNRKKSKPKILVQIPRQLITHDDNENPVASDASYTLSNLTLKEFIDKLFFVTTYLQSLEPIVKESAVKVNLVTEMDNLLQTTSDIIAVLEKNKQFPTGDQDQIRINFVGSDPPRITELYAIPTIKKDDVLPGEDPMTPEEIDFYSDAIKIDIKDKFTSRYFNNTRTMFLIINLDLMAQEIGSDLNAATNKLKWIDFLNKYIFRMPEYYPSATKANDNLSSSEAALRSLFEKESEMLEGMTYSAIQGAINSIGTEVRASVGKMRRQVFEKIEDPTMKYIFQNLGQINSTEALYRLVIDRIPMEDLFLMVRKSMSPIPGSSLWIDKVEDTVYNLKSRGMTRQEFDHQVRRKFLGFKNDAENFGKDLKEQFELITNTQKGKVYDVTEGTTEALYAAIKEAIDESVVNAFKTILEIIKGNLNSGSDIQKSKKIGTFDIEENLKENEAITIKNNLNSFNNVYLDNPDIAKILKIISDLSTPMEILALFEGTADLEVVDIVGEEIATQMPILEDELKTIYQKESFFITIGQGILQSITTAIGNHEIEFEKQTRKNEEEILNFCSPGELNDIVDHLSDRFPQTFAQNQLSRQDLQRQKLQDFIDSLENAIKNGTIQDLLYGSKITDLLNSNKFKSRSSSMVEDLVIKSYFDPIVSMMDAESLVIDNHFTSTQVVPDKNPNTPLPPPIQIEINRLRAEGGDANEKLANDIENKAKKNKKKIVTGINKDVKELQQIMKEGPCSYDFSNKSPERYTIGGGLKKVILEYPTIGSLPIMEGFKVTDPDEGIILKDDGSIGPIFDDAEDVPSGNDKLANAGKFKMIASVIENNKEKILYTNEKEIIFTPYMQNLVNLEDEDMSMQKSAFSTLVKNIFVERGFQGNDWDEKVDQVLKDIKNYIFDFSNQTLLNFISLETSKSSFFNVINLQKLKFSPTQGDTRTPPLLCEFVDDPEAGETPSTSEEIVDSIITIDDLLEDIRGKEQFFSILEKDARKKIMNRTPIENAIIMGITEMFFKAVALEFLISGIFAFGEVNIKTLLKDKHNFKVLEDMIFFTMETLGNEFKNSFSSYLMEYAEIRQKINPEAIEDYVSPMPGKLSLNEIAQFILTEQVEYIYKPFQKALHAVSNKTKLEVDEFLDFIPCISVPRSTITGPGPNNEGGFYESVSGVNPGTSKKLRDTYKYGGFILEKYIRTEWAILPDAPSALSQEVLIKPKEQVFLLDGKWEPIGNVDDIDSTMLENLIDAAAKIIRDAAVDAGKNDETYGKYWYKKTTQKTNYEGMKTGAVTTTWHVKSLSTIKQEIKNGTDNLGKDYLKTLPGYAEYKDQIDQVKDNSAEPNRAFKVGTRTGKVSLQEFSIMQKKLNEINTENNLLLGSNKKLLDQLTSKDGQIKVLTTKITTMVDQFKDSWQAVDQGIAAYKMKFDNLYPVTGEGVTVEEGFFTDDIIVNESDEFMYRNPTSELAFYIRNKLFNVFKNNWYRKNGDYAGERFIKFFEKDVYPAIAAVVPEIQPFIDKHGTKTQLAITTYVSGLTLQELIDFMTSLSKISSISFAAFDALFSAMVDFHDEVINIFGGVLKNPEGIIQAGFYGARIDKLKGKIYLHETSTIPYYKDYAAHYLPKYNKELEILEERTSFAKSYVTPHVNYSMFIAEGFREIVGEIFDFLENELGDLTADEEFQQYQAFYASEIKEKQNLISNLESQILEGPSMKFLASPLKYGIRLSYVYPSFNEIGVGGLDTAYVKEPQSEIPLMESIKANVEKIAGTYTEKFNYYEKSFRSKEVIPVGTGVERYEVIRLPFLEIEENIEAFMEKDPEILDTKIVSNFPLKTLKEKMLEQEEFQSLLSEVLLFPDLVSAFGFYSSLFTIQKFFKRNSLGIFSGTKMNIKDLFLTTTESKDFTYNPQTETLSDLMKNNIVNMNNMTDNPSAEEGFKPDPFGYEAMVVAKTGMTILKRFVELTDPAIIRGKQIQNAVVGALKAADSVAGAISSMPGGGATDIQEELGLGEAAESAAGEGLLLPIVMFGVRPFPPIPFPVGDPTAPLTGPGVAYLQLSALGGDNSASAMYAGKTDQELLEEQNPEQNCIDE